MIDAITGNSRFLASLGATGRLYRLWWPHIEIQQQVDWIRSGLFMEAGALRGEAELTERGQL